MQIHPKWRSIPWMLRESRMRIIDGFTFYEFCQFCQKIAKHRIETDSSMVLGVCESCAHSQQLSELNEVFYDKTDLWVTRFKMSNMNNVVVGRLLHALRSWKHSFMQFSHVYCQLNFQISNAHAFANSIWNWKSNLGSQCNILVLYGTANRILWPRGKKWWRKVFSRAEKKWSNT